MSILLSSSIPIPSTPIKLFTGLKEFIAHILNFICRPDFIAYKHTDYKNIPLRFIKKVFGVATIAWTVRSEKEEKDALSHGFDGVIFENYAPMP